MDLIPTCAREADLPTAALTLSAAFQIRYHRVHRNGYSYDETTVAEYCELLVDGADLGLLEVVEEETNNGQVTALEGISN